MFEWFSIQSGVVWKTTQVCLGGKKIFSSYKSFQLLMALKICRWPIFNMPFHANKLFQKQTVFLLSKVDHIINYCKRPSCYFHIPNLKNVIINNTAFSTCCSPLTTFCGKDVYNGQQYDLTDEPLLVSAWWK